MIVDDFSQLIRIFADVSIIGVTWDVQFLYAHLVALQGDFQLFDESIPFLLAFARRLFDEVFHFVHPFAACIELFQQIVDLGNFLFLEVQVVL